MEECPPVVPGRGSCVSARPAAAKVIQILWPASAISWPDRTQLVSDNLEQTWTRFSGQVVLESRVKARLHWDKSLADASIEVHATEKVVELKGSLPSPAQVSRAVELA